MPYDDDWNMKPTRVAREKCGNPTEKGKKVSFFPPNLSFSPPYRSPEEGLFLLLLKLIRHNEIYLPASDSDVCRVLKTFLCALVKVPKKVTSLFEFSLRRTFGGFPSFTCLLVGLGGKAP